MIGSKKFESIRKTRGRKQQTWNRTNQANEQNREKKHRQTGSCRREFDRSSRYTRFSSFMIIKGIACKQLSPTEKYSSRRRAARGKLMLENLFAFKFSWRSRGQNPIHGSRATKSHQAIREYKQIQWITSHYYCCDINTSCQTKI